MRENEGWEEVTASAQLPPRQTALCAGRRSLSRTGQAKRRALGCGGGAVGMCRTCEESGMCREPSAVPTQEHGRPTCWAAQEGAVLPGRGFRPGSPSPCSGGQRHQREHGDAAPEPGGHHGLRGPEPGAAAGRVRALLRGAGQHGQRAVRAARRRQPAARQSPQSGGCRGASPPHTVPASLPPAHTRPRAEPVPLPGVRGTGTARPRTPSGIFHQERGVGW